MESGDLSQLRIEKSGESSALRHTGGRRRWAVAVILAALGAAGVVLWKAWPAPEVQTATAALTYPSQALTVLNASGYVVAQRKAAVSSKVTGRLIWLGVEEGSVVKAGQIIAKLESDDLRAAKEQAVANVEASNANVANARARLEEAGAAARQARAALEQAHAEQDDAGRAFTRQKELFAVGVTNRADYDAAETRHRRAAAAVSGASAAVQMSERSVAAAQAALSGAVASVEAAGAAVREAAVNVEYALLRAPFDAVVLTKNADLGDVVTPIGSAANAKAAVVTIADLASVQVEADVSESNLSKIRAGQPCEIQLDALPDRRIPGALHTIVPTADRSKGTVMTKVRFLETDKRVLPEMSAKVAFLARSLRPGEERPRVTVNPGAVVTRAGRSIVYVVQAGSAVETAVTLGPPLGDAVEVRQGLKGGEKVVLSPSPRLRNGDKVKVLEG